MEFDTLFSYNLIVCAHLYTLVYSSEPSLYFFWCFKGFCQGLGAVCRASRENGRDLHTVCEFAHSQHCIHFPHHPFSPPPSPPTSYTSFPSLHPIFPFLPLSLFLLPRQAGEFQMYSVYCKNRSNSEALLSEQPENEAFFKGIQINLDHQLPLNSYLLKPVQRVTKYQLLLKVAINTRVVLVVLANTSLSPALVWPQSVVW